MGVIFSRFVEVEVVLCIVVDIVGIIRGIDFEKMSVLVIVGDFDIKVVVINGVGLVGYMVGVDFVV